MKKIREEQGSYETSLLSEIPENAYEDFDFPPWARYLNLKISMFDLFWLGVHKIEFDKTGDTIKVIQAYLICVDANIPFPVWVTKTLSKGFNAYLNRGIDLGNALDLLRRRESPVSKLQRQDRDFRLCLEILRLRTWTDISLASAYKAVSAKSCAAGVDQVENVYRKYQKDICELFSKTLRAASLNDRQKFLKTFPEYSLPLNLKIRQNS